MTDDRSRRDHVAPPDGSIAIEVPLTGSGDAASPPPDEPRPPNWRRGPAIAVLAGAALVGVVVTIQAIGGDDEAAAPEPTAVDELASQITTPPTLGALDTLPSPDDPALARESRDGGPQPATSQDRSLFADAVTRPSYPPVTDVGLPELVTYDIAAAVARLGEDVPRRSETHLELGTAGFVLDVTIERDPDRDRFRIRVETQSETQEAIVDVATGLTYVRSDGDFVADVPNDEIIEGSTASDIREYFDRLLLGPVRPDSFNAAATRGRSVVTVGDVRVARQFIANVQGPSVPEWQVYAFGPVFEFPVEDRPSLLEYAVYVDDDGDIVQVDGVSRLGSVPQLIEHRLIHLGGPIVIDLPPDLAEPPSSEPASSTPTTAPTTTPTTVTAEG